MQPLARYRVALGFSALVAAGLLACDGNGGTDIIDPGTPGTNVVVLDGDVTGPRTLRADSVYVIQGFLEIQPGGTLTIPAGTELVSDINTKGSIVGLRGEGGQPSGRLVVQGTAANPVVFRPGTVETAGSLVPAQAESCSRGQAGGIVLHGRAPINLPGGTGVSEGVARPFGGDDPNDSSGDIQYLVILCGGVKVTPDNEINGLTMAGVGSGTRISFVQAHAIADDGFEWFGGTVHGDHLVSSANDDDAFDCDFGWNGTVQFGVAVQDRALANRGIECDNDGDGSGNQPITSPTFWNFTWVGAGVERANSEVNDGLYLRRNSAPKIYNSIVANFGNVGVVIDGNASVAQAQAGTLDLDNLLFFGNQGLALAQDEACLTENVFFRLGGEYTNDGVAAAFSPGTFVCADPEFGTVNYGDPIDGAMPDLRPQAGSPALDGANALAPEGPGVDATARYLGAMSATNWLAGWTSWIVPN